MDAESLALRANSFAAVCTNPPWRCQVSRLAENRHSCPGPTTRSPESRPVTGSSSSSRTAYDTWHDANMNLWITTQRLTPRTTVAPNVEAHQHAPIHDVRRECRASVREGETCLINTGPSPKVHNTRNIPPSVDPAWQRSARATQAAYARARGCQTSPVGHALPIAFCTCSRQRRVRLRFRRPVIRHGRCMARPFQRQRRSVSRRHLGAITTVGFKVIDDSRVRDEQRGTCSTRFSRRTTASRRRVETSRRRVCSNGSTRIVNCERNRRMNSACK